MILYWLESIGVVVLRSEGFQPNNEFSPTGYMTAELFGRTRPVLVAIAPLLPTLPRHASANDSRDLWLIGRLPSNIRQSKGILVQYVSSDGKSMRFALEASPEFEKNRPRFSIQLHGDVRSPPTFKLSKSTDAAVSDPKVVGSMTMGSEDPVTVTPYRVEKISSHEKTIHIHLSSDRYHRNSITLEQSTTESELPIDECCAIAVFRRRDWLRLGEDVASATLVHRASNVPKLVFSLRHAGDNCRDKLLKIDRRDATRLRLNLNILPRDLVAVLPLANTKIYAHKPRTKPVRSDTNPEEASSEEKNKTSYADSKSTHTTLPDLDKLAVFEATGTGLIPWPIADDPSSPDDELFLYEFQKWLSNRSTHRTLENIIATSPERNVTYDKLSWLWEHPILAAQLQKPDYQILANAAPLIAAVEALWDPDFHEFFTKTGFRAEILPLVSPSGPTEEFRKTMVMESDVSNEENLFPWIAKQFWKKLPDDWPGDPRIQANIITGLVRESNARSLAITHSPGLQVFEDFLMQLADPNTREDALIGLNRAQKLLITTEKSETERSASRLLAQAVGVDVLVSALPSVSALLGLSSARGYSLNGLKKELLPLGRTLTALSENVDQKLQEFDDITYRALIHGVVCVNDDNMPKLFEFGNDLFSNNKTSIKINAAASRLIDAVEKLKNGENLESTEATL